MHESLTGKQILGYQILERVKEEQDWEEYRAVKEGVTGRLLRTLQVAYYPSQEEYNRYVENIHAQDREVQQYFATCLQEILDKLSQLELLSEAEESHLLPIYESDVDWDSQRKQYMIYMIREEALCLPEWEDSQDITVEMLLTMGEQMLKATDVYKGSERFHAGDIFMLSKDEFCLGNLERYAIFKADAGEENPLISVYYSYIHIFYETSQEMWEQKTLEEKRTIEILCFLHYYLKGKNVEEDTGESETVSGQIWELLIFCTQNQIVAGEIAKRIAAVQENLDCQERERICVSQRMAICSMNGNKGMEGLKKRLTERTREYRRGILAGTVFLFILGLCFLGYQRKRETGIRYDNIKGNSTNQKATAEEYTTQKRAEQSTIQSKKEKNSTQQSTTRAKKEKKSTQESTIQSKKGEESTQQTEEKQSSYLQKSNYINSDKNTNQDENIHNKNNQNKNQNESKIQDEDEKEREGWDIQWE